MMGIGLFVDGTYNSSDAGSNASFRNTDAPTQTERSVGSRMMLYIND